MAKSNVTRRRVLDNARARIVQVLEDPHLLDEAYETARQFGPSYGYANAQDWWDTQGRTYPELFNGTYGEPFEMPAWVTAVAPVASGTPAGEVTDEEQAALTYLANYEGTFEFLTDLRGRVRQGRALTPRQVDAVLRCKARDTQRATPPPQHAEAVAELERLALAGQLNDFTMSLYTQAQTRTLTERQVAAVLRGRKPQGATRNGTPQVTEDGMYRTADGTIFKVQHAVNGSGRLYAKRLVPPDGDGARARFVYESGAVMRLTPADRMTMEQARAFGALYGTCCVCARTLTDEGSIAAGIGPICAGNL